MFSLFLIFLSHFLFSVQAIQLYDNRLTGSIPFQFQKLTQLKLLDLSNNRLDGNFDALFRQKSNMTATTTKLFQQLQQMDISSNALTGTLPPALFEIPLLSHLIMYTNCMSGSLPSSMCLASEMQVLVLDDLTSASSCDRLIPIALQPMCGPCLA